MTSFKILSSYYENFPSYMVFKSTGENVENLCSTKSSIPHLWSFVTGSIAVLNVHMSHCAMIHTIRCIKMCCCGLIKPVSKQLRHDTTA